MRGLRLAAVAIFLAGMCVLASADKNKFGVQDEQKAVFSHEFRVGDALLPQGEYRIQHTMEGADHVMVFTQLHTSKPATARAKCQLVPVEKVEQTYFGYKKETPNGYLLQEFAFKGDSAKHVF